MKRGELRIHRLRDGQGVTVTGVFSDLGGLFIHKSISLDPDSRDRSYTVTHCNTGMGVCKADKQGVAKLIVAELDPWGWDWNTTDDPIPFTRDSVEEVVRGHGGWMHG